MQKLIKNILKHKYKWLAVGYTIWLTAVSLTPLEGIDLPSFSYADKIVHFFLYFFLTVFWLLAYPQLWHKKFRFILIVILWGIAIEFIQEYFIPTRSGDVFDALANTLGGIAGMSLFHRIRKYLTL
jgi:VanZ family protein